MQNAAKWRFLIPKSVQLAPDNPPPFGDFSPKTRGGYLEKILRTKVHGRNKVNVKNLLCLVQTFFYLSCPVYNIKYR